MRNYGFWFLSVGMLVAGCGGGEVGVKSEAVTTAPGDVKSDADATHYLATNCELFIDKVEPYNQDHGEEYLQLYLKTHNDRLDGKLVEVGFRNKFTGNAPVNTVVFYDWRNDVAPAYDGASDYFALSIFANSTELGSDYLHEGAFYVKTDKNIYYWVKPNNSNSTNYFFDANAFNNAIGVYGHPDNHSTPSPNNAIASQDYRLRYYNYNDCF